MSVIYYCTDACARFPTCHSMPFIALNALHVIQENAPMPVCPAVGVCVGV